MERKKYLAKNTALFALNSIGSKLIVFLLVPVYTAALSNSEYGLTDLVTTISAVAVPILTFNINESVMRFSLDEDADLNKIMSVGIGFMLFSVALGLAVIPAAGLFPELYPYRFSVYGFFVANGIFRISISGLRGQEKLADFAVCNILMTLCSALMNILLLVVFRMGVEGYFLALITADLVGALYAVIRANFVRTVFHLQFDRKLLAGMVKFSVFLIPNSLMWWIMHSSDHLMVTAMVGLAANGIYAISYKIPSVLSTLSTVFNQAWSYSAIREDKSGDREAFSNRMFGNLVFFLLLITAVLMAVMRPFLTIYVSETYYEAWRYTPYLLIGNFFLTLGTFLSTSYTVNKDSKGFLLSGTIGGVLNIALNAALIPFIGVTGAALATMISYIVVFLYRCVDTKKYIVIHAFRRRYAAGYLLLLAMGATMLFDTLAGNILLAVETAAMFVLCRKFIASVFRGGLRLIKRKTTRKTAKGDHTMKTVCRIDQCAGCKACTNVCAKDAIRVETGLDRYNAVIDESRCVNCGACERVCPVGEPPALLPASSWRQGWAAEEEIRRRGSSGGLATAVAAAFVRDGGVCAACVGEGSAFRFRLLETVEDVYEMSGSKYVKSDPDGIYAAVREKLESGRKVLMIGLPCQIAAMKKSLPAPLCEALYTIDLICHGTPSPAVLNAFLSQYRGGEPEKLEFRQKTKFQLRANGKTVTPPGIRDRYLSSYLKAYTYTENCYSCPYARAERVGDLTLGDSWGSELPKEEREKGVSLILCQTEKGEELLALAKPVLLPVDRERAIRANKNLSAPCEKTPQREKLFRALGKGKKFNRAVFRAEPKDCIKQDVKLVLRKLKLR